ncbi:MAG: hypothetical protein OXJ52_08315 [Oligoflexia bacterium]|nr:hypothetical protein [Oligoflexia bacterium]
MNKLMYLFLIISSISVKAQDGAIEVLPENSYWLTCKALYEYKSIGLKCKEQGEGCLLPIGLFGSKFSGDGIVRNELNTFLAEVANNCSDGQMDTVECALKITDEWLRRRVCHRFKERIWGERK